MRIDKLRNLIIPSRRPSSPSGSRALGNDRVAARSLVCSKRALDGGWAGRVGIRLDYGVQLVDKGDDIDHAIVATGAGAWGEFEIGRAHV